MIGRGRCHSGCWWPGWFSITPKQIRDSECCSAPGEHCFYIGMGGGVSLCAICARIVKGTCFRTVPCPVKQFRKQVCSDGLTQGHCSHPFSMLTCCGGLCFLFLQAIWSDAPGRSNCQNIPESVLMISEPFCVGIATPATLKRGAAKARRHLAVVVPDC